jgi:hypothetical protein
MIIHQQKIHLSKFINMLKEIIQSYIKKFHLLPKINNDCIRQGMLELEPINYVNRMILWLLLGPIVLLLANKVSKLSMHYFKILRLGSSFSEHSSEGRLKIRYR